MSTAHGTKRGKSLPAPKKSRTKNVPVNGNAATEVASEEFKVDSPFFSKLCSPAPNPGPELTGQMLCYRPTSRLLRSSRSG
jgi:hypothetical protein